MSAYGDNGGSTAIQGFNYQKAAIMLVIVNNYHKDGFKVIPESEEDFVIKVENKTYYIQVKGTKKLSINKLISRKKAKNQFIPSIIEKNLVPGNNEDERQIFLWDLTDSTKKDIFKDESSIVTPVYKISENKKNHIIKTLRLSDSQILRLNKQQIYMTPFSNSFEVALTMIKGKMAENGLLVINTQAMAVLNWLSVEIDKKSELKVIDEKDLLKKEINQDELNSAFIKMKQKEKFDEILNNLPFNTAFKQKINEAKLEIIYLYQSEKKELKNSVVEEEYINKSSDEEVIKYFLEILKKINSELNEQSSIAIAIDCLSELGGM